MPNFWGRYHYTNVLGWLGSKWITARKCELGILSIGVCFQPSSKERLQNITFKIWNLAQIFFMRLAFIWATIYVREFCNILGGTIFAKGK